MDQFRNFTDRLMTEMRLSTLDAPVDENPEAQGTV
jgi:hypothetical protein